MRGYDATILKGRVGSGVLDVKTHKHRHGQFVTATGKEAGLFPIRSRFAYEVPSHAPGLTSPQFLTRTIMSRQCPTPHANNQLVCTLICTVPCTRHKTSPTNWPAIMRDPFTYPKVLLIEVWPMLAPRPAVSRLQLAP